MREILLNCIVRQMDTWLIVLQRVGVGCSPDVSLLIEVPTNFALSGCNHYVMSKVKLSVLIEKRFLEIRLDYVGSIASIVVCLLLLYFIFYLFQIPTILDMSSSITKLSWLDDPMITTFFVSLIELSQKPQILFIF